MTATIESNTQAILLLTAPLRASAKGGSDTDAKPLSLGEYNELARGLRERKRAPSDLLGDDAPRLLAECRGGLDGARIERLLARGFALAQASEFWHARSIWVVSRAEPHYPRRLRQRLKETMPPVLYGCGDIGLCESGGLAIVGSRDATEAQLRFAADAAQDAARFHRTVVSGGARGVDQAAMSAAIEAGGNVVGMLADGLARAAIDRRNREPLRSGRLVLLSICDPSAGFHTGIAMQRNRLIYALADAGLVVNAELGKGGTWAGAIEQLDKLRYVPMYLRQCGELGKGMEALRERGAVPWPQPQSAEELDRALAAAPVPHAIQFQLPFRAGAESDVVREAAPTQTIGTTNDVVEVTAPAQSSADQLFDVVRVLVGKVESPQTEAEVAGLLGVTKAQAKAWLVRLVADGVMEKTKKPVRYRVVPGRGSSA